MELGGNAPFIVFDDADIDRAVEGAMVAKYRNSGQTCVCTNRFFVQAGVYDVFVEKLADASRKLKVGAGLEEGTQQGPLIDDKAVEKVEEFVRDAKAKGGKIVAGGNRHALGGTFFEPTVIAESHARHDGVHEGGVFGPVTTVFRFEDGGAGGQPCQRHRIRPRLLLLHRQSRPRLPGHGRAEIRDGGRQ